MNWSLVSLMPSFEKQIKLIFCSRARYVCVCVNFVRFTYQQSAAVTVAKTTLKNRLWRYNYRCVFVWVCAFHNNIHGHKKKLKRECFHLRSSLSPAMCHHRQSRARLSHWHWQRRSTSTKQTASLAMNATTNALNENKTLLFTREEKKTDFLFY